MRRVPNFLPGHYEHGFDDHVRAPGSSYSLFLKGGNDTNFGMTGIDLENMDFIDDDDDYNDPESTDQPSDNDKRNSSNTELDFDYTQDVD